MLYCESCGAEVSENDRFCYKCGYPLPKLPYDTKACPICDRTVRGDAYYCPGCGMHFSPFVKLASDETSEKAENQQKASDITPAETEKLIKDPPKQKELRSDEEKAQKELVLSDDERDERKALKKPKKIRRRAKREKPDTKKLLKTAVPIAVVAALMISALIWANMAARTVVPTPAPSPAVTESPVTPSPVPTKKPAPSPSPSPEISPEPTPEPTLEPTPEPTLEPTPEPDPVPEAVAILYNGEIKKEFTMYVGEPPLPLTAYVQPGDLKNIRENSKWYSENEGVIKVNLTDEGCVVRAVASGVTDIICEVYGVQARCTVHVYRK